MDNNRIDTVEAATFIALEKLEVLTLSNNRLRGLNKRVFFLLSSLRTLDLSGNPIRELDPEVLKDLNSLRVLRCARCELTRIRSLVYKRIVELEELDLRDNKIEILSSEEYIDLKYLKILHLDGNRLFIIRDHVFKGLGLKILGLSRNHMEKISRYAFEDCSVLNLDISYNKISYSSLRHINPIIEHIHELNLSNIKIHARHLRDLFKKAVRLKKLDLHQMHLNQLLPDMFESQSKLEVLNISRNNLKFVPVEILHSLTSLHAIDLSRNDMKGLPELILRRLDRVRDVDLYDNPWTCDQCHIPQLKTWINSSKEFRESCYPNIDSQKCLKCQYPFELFDKPIIEVEGLALQPCPEGAFEVTVTEGSSTFTLILAIVVACVVILILVVILVVGIVMYNRHSAFYYTHENNARSRFYDNSALHSNHTDVTMADDIGAIPDPENNDRQKDFHISQSASIIKPDDPDLVGIDPSIIRSSSVELRNELKDAAENSVERRKKVATSLYS